MCYIFLQKYKPDFNYCDVNGPIKMLQNSMK